MTACECGCNQHTPLDTTITALQVARLSMYKLTGLPSAAVTDMINAVNDLIAGAEELQRERTE